MVAVLYDGWPLIYAPNSPQALHLLAILACRSETLQAHLALPGEPPAWLPAGAEAHVIPAEDTPYRRLVWEQWALPGLRRRLGADLLHLTTPNPPLSGSPATLVSPASCDEAPPRTFSERLRQAASQGGMASLGGLVWPDDLPPPQGMRPVYTLPPLVGTDFTATRQPTSPPVDRQVDLPEGAVLYHGPGDESSLRGLLSAWSWAAGPLGEAYPLVALGLDEAARARFSTLAQEYELGDDKVHSLPPLAPQALAAAYRGSAALLHPAPEPAWGGPVRQALACGLPVVSIEDSRTGALVGPAAYLVKSGDARLLGAALITVLVEADLSENLAQAGLARAAGWSPAAFAAGLAQLYASLGES